jgi:lipoyl(octanoyl) transferase
MIRVEWLGRVPYADALEIQRGAVEARLAGAEPDRLLLLEHPPVVTLGRRARREHLLASPAELAARGIALHEAQRGGDVTWHGPGQLVGYPIVHLDERGARDVHLFLRGIESALVEALSALGVAAGRRPGMTGVFVERPSGAAGPERKIASIGVGLRRWVSFHGFALNVTADLAGFRDIVPCGLHEVEMTSVARERGDASGTAGLDAAAREAVAKAFRAWLG